MKERLEYFDGLKAFCILLVIYAHTSYFPNNSIIGNIITSLTWAGVPCFMMITGALFHQKESFDWKIHFQRIFKTYIILCIWKAIYLLIGITTNNVKFGILSYVQYIFLFLNIDGVYYGHTWYMIAYIIAMFMYPITYFLFTVENNGKKYGRIILCFIALLCFFDGILIHEADWWFERLLKLLSISKLPLVGIEELLPFRNYSNMIFYFILGSLIYEYREKISCKISKYKYFLFFSLFFGLFWLILIKYMEVGSFYNEGTFVTIGYNRIATIIMSLSLYLIFYEYKDKMKSMNHFIGGKIGVNTLGIFYIHNITIMVVNDIFDKISFPLNNDIISILLPILIVLITNLVTILLKKIPVVSNLVK